MTKDLQENTLPCNPLRHPCDIFPNFKSGGHLTVARKVTLLATYFLSAKRIQGKPLQLESRSL